VDAGGGDAAGLGPDGGGPDASGLDAHGDQQLSVLTYNVAGLPEGLSSSMPERLTPLIGPLLNDYQLVLLQESWRTPEPNPMAPTRVYHEILEEASEHPYKSEPAPAPLGSDPDRPTALLGDGLNRFSDFTFGEVTRERWAGCNDSAADCLALKGFSVARTTLEEGIEVDVYNLHMEAGSTPDDDDLRDAGIDQLLTFISDFSADRAVLVGGDFNLHTDAEPAASQLARLLSEGGLQDACTELGCPRPGSIDKILLRSSDQVALEALGWRAETDVFVAEDGTPLSDHDPITVDVGYRKL
jgi:endonuclease/exonuclease/phosphatase family metal-dependent hydrolase